MECLQLSRENVSWQLEAKFRKELQFRREKHRGRNVTDLFRWETIFPAKCYNPRSRKGFPSASVTSRGGFSQQGCSSSALFSSRVLQLCSAPWECIISAPVMEVFPAKVLQLCSALAKAVRALFLYRSSDAEMQFCSARGLVSSQLCPPP